MKYHITVFGCQMNISDAERISAVLDSAGIEPASKIDKADVAVVTMCSVRQSAVDRVHWLAQKFKKIKKDKPNLITVLTGCVLKKDQPKFSKGFDYVLDIRDINKLPEILKIKKVKNCENYLEVLPKYSSKKIAYVPIMTGCNNFCSYCVVPYTRNREVSRPAKKILAEVKNIVKTGVKEIWLLGQNVNSYKGEINFPKLLKMVNDVPGNFTLNFTSSHPKDFSDELIETMPNCNKLSKKLNLPIQSGDDQVLKRMNRPYTVLQYKNLVKKIRKAIPDVLLSTDVIVGFPGETKKEFNNTVKTFKEIGFSLAFINKYSPRAGTAAALMEDDVPWPEKKRREKILIDLINAKHKK